MHWNVAKLILSWREISVSSRLNIIFFAKLWSLWSQTTLLNIIIHFPLLESFENPSVSDPSEPQSNPFKTLLIFCLLCCQCLSALARISVFPNRGAVKQASMRLCMLPCFLTPLCFSKKWFNIPCWLKSNSRIYFALRLPFISQPPWLIRWSGKSMSEKKLVKLLSS